MSSDSTPTVHPSNTDYGQMLLKIAVDKFIESQSGKQTSNSSSERDRSSPYPPHNPAKGHHDPWPIVHGGAAKLRTRFANNIRGQFLLLTDELKPAGYNPYVQPDTVLFQQPVFVFDALLFREHRDGMRAMDRMWTPSFTLYNELIVYAEASEAPPLSRDVWKAPAPAVTSNGDVEMEVIISTGEAAVLPPNSLSNSTSYSSSITPLTNTSTVPAPAAPPIVQTPTTASSTDAAIRSTRSSTSKVIASKD